jgi:D-glycero-alpha-D-manno-heptose 1-phosphate guanylyltransferase
MKKNDILKKTELEKPLIILAGGFGTRLQSILKGNPKPLADINGVPFLQLLFVNWINQGFSIFILSLHFEHDRIINFVDDLKKSILINCEVHYIIEGSPLGTGGAVSYVVEKLSLKDYFFIVNADTWIDSGFVELDSIEGNAMGLVQSNNTSRYGNVVLDDLNKVVMFEEKNQNNSSGLINAGIYKLSAKLFLNWNSKPYSLERDLFPNLIQSKSLIGVELNTEFIDIGIPEDYLTFCNWKKII